MASPYAGEVTRPDSFDGAKDYALVIARGDRPLGDYDLNDLQRIQRLDDEVFMSLVLEDGAVALEVGGTIATPQAGIVIGGDTLGSSGTYRGVRSQLYTVRVVTGGAAGTATYTWETTGEDAPEYAGQTFPITAIAPSVLQALADPLTYGHPVGSRGVIVYFCNANGVVHGTSSWVVQATYGARAPIVDGDTLTVAELLVRVSGRVHRVPGATLTYTTKTSGIDLVYGVWTRERVTHLDDAGLTDPLSGDSQAWRERWRMVLSATDPSATPVAASVLERRVIALYQWDRASNDVRPVIRNPYAIDLGKTQGALTADRLLNIEQSVTFGGTLATRIEEPHGGFVVSPALPTPRAVPSTNTASAGKLLLSLPPIIAYVDGVRVVKPLPTEVEVDQATDFGVVTDEPITFATGTDLYDLAKGVAGYPIRAISKVTAHVAVTNVAMTRGSGATDTIPYSNIVSIQAVRKGGTTYVATTDYTVAGSVITWVTPDTGSTNPAQNDAYTIDLTYNKTLVPDTDYQLTGNQLDFSPAGDNPVNGTNPEVDYSYYLPRIDVLALRPSGAVEVVRGTPAEVALVPITPQYALDYVRVAVPPNAADVVITAVENDRVTMAELCQLRELVRELFVNFALQDLANQARTLNTARFLDVWADAFATLDQGDLTYNVGGVAFDATIDTGANELTLPFTETLHPLVYTATGSSVRVGTAFWTLPYADEVALDAPLWSMDYPVNPYADFRPEPVSARLSPDRDFWIDTTTLDSTRSRIVQNGRHENYRIVRSFTTSQTQTRDVAAQFMRASTVAVEAFHLVSEENVRVLFDGKLVEFTAAAPASQGGDAYTVVARAADPTHAYGDLAGTFTVPDDVPAGTVSVVLWGDQGKASSVWPDDYTPRATLLFSSTGVLRTVATETTITIVQNDPVAQSFNFPAARMVTKVEVPLASTPATKDANTPPVVFELRATDRAGEASTPTSEVLARVAKFAPEAAASGAFLLPDPVYCPADLYRAIVLRSASNEYRVHVAQVGGPDRVHGGLIGTQQIEGGIFLDSANNADWTPRQGWDLRCRVSVAHMTALSGVLRFTALSQANTTGLYLAPDQVVPDGTSITWQYSTDGSTWIDFQPFTVTELAAVTSTVYVRALLATTDPYVTPSVHRSNCVVSLLSNKAAGTYVSEAFDLPSGTTSSHITGRLEVFEPSGTTATAVKVSVDGGSTWTTATLSTTGTLADGWVQKQFDKSGLGAGQQLRLRLDLATGNRAARPRVRRLFAYAV